MAKALLLHYMVKGFRNKARRVAAKEKANARGKGPARAMDFNQEMELRVFFCMSVKCAAIASRAVPLAHKAVASKDNTSSHHGSKAKVKIQITAEMKARNGKSNFVVAVGQSFAGEAAVVLPLQVERSN